MMLEWLGIYIPKKKKKKNLDTVLSPFTKINSKWIVNLKHKTIKFLENNIGENLEELEYSSSVLKESDI